MDVFSKEFQGFPENGKVSFDCAGASGLRFMPFIFSLCALTFAHHFSDCFFIFFGPPLDTQNQGRQSAGGRGGTSLNEFD